MCSLVLLMGSGKGSNLPSAHQGMCLALGPMSPDSHFNILSGRPILGGFPGGSVVKNLPDIAGDVGLIPESRRYLGRGNGNPLHVFLPGKSHGRKSLVDYSPWGHKESDVTEHGSTAQTHPYALLNEVLKANDVNNVN